MRTTKKPKASKHHPSRAGQINFRAGDRIFPVRLAADGEFVCDSEGVAAWAITDADEGEIVISQTCPKAEWLHTLRHEFYRVHSLYIHEPTNLTARAMDFADAAGDFDRQFEQCGGLPALFALKPSEHGGRTKVVQNSAQPPDDRKTREQVANAAQKLVEEEQLHLGLIDLNVNCRVENGRKICEITRVTKDDKEQSLAKIIPVDGVTDEVGMALADLLIQAPTLWRFLREDIQRFFSELPDDPELGTEIGERLAAMSLAVGRPPFDPPQPHCDDKLTIERMAKLAVA